MTKNQYDHTDPNPLRPSQAEGEAEETEKPSADPTEEPARKLQSEAEHVDPNPIRPSQAEGDDTNG